MHIVKRKKSELKSRLTKCILCFHRISKIILGIYCDLWSLLFSAFYICWWHICAAVPQVIWDGLFFLHSVSWRVKLPSERVALAQRACRALVKPEADALRVEHVKHVAR